MADNCHDHLCQISSLSTIDQVALGKAVVAADNRIAEGDTTFQTRINNAVT